MLPRGTLPKFRAVGLALKAEEAVDPVEEVAEIVEVPLALVTPAQPHWTMAINRVVANTKRART